MFKVKKARKMTTKGTSKDAIVESRGAGRSTVSASSRASFALTFVSATVAKTAKRNYQIISISLTIPHQKI